MIFVDDELVILLETDQPAAVVIEDIHANRWPLPPPLAALAAAGEPNADRLLALPAVSLGRLVILSPVNLAKGRPCLRRPERRPSNSARASARCCRGWRMD